MADWSLFVADREEYSRYEYMDGRSIITITLDFDPGFTPSVGEGVTVRLVRKDGYGDVGSVTLTFAGGENTAFGLTIDLETCVDDDGFYVARAGWYHLEVDRLDVLGDVVSTTIGPNLFVSMITAERFKKRWLYGIPLIASAVLTALEQPTNVTGVTITRVSSSHPPGVYGLVFTQATGMVTWGGGTAVDISSTGSYRLILGATGRDYIEIIVRAHSLPASAKTDNVAIDYMPLDDAMLRDFIRDAVNWTIAASHVLPEPAIYATPLLQDVATHGWHDEIGTALPYYRPGNWNKWLSINMPFHWLLAVYNLDGYFNDELAVDIPDGWVTFSEKSSILELVPRRGAISWLYYGTTAWSLWAAKPHIPQFWQYRALFGLRDLRDQRGTFLTMVGAKAGMLVAPQLGEAMTGGRSSYSVSRDGISESRSYAPGVWQTRLQQWEKDTDRKAVSQLKRKLVGIPMTVLG